MDAQLPFDGFYVTAPAKSGMDKQGQQANFSGSAAEEAILHILKTKGYSVRRRHKLSEKSLHGGRIFVDFMVGGIHRFPNGLIIESKWQDDQGSADEKIVFLIENIKRKYTAPTMIVYGGGGARAGIIDFARSQVDNQKLIAVLSFEEFLSWAIRNL